MNYPNNFTKFLGLYCGYYTERKTEFGTQLSREVHAEGTTHHIAFGQEACNIPLVLVGGKVEGAITESSQVPHLLSNASIITCKNV